MCDKNFKKGDKVYYMSGGERSKNDFIVDYVSGDKVQFTTGGYMELWDEIYNKGEDKPPGEDGIVGEAIDVILCMIDLINLDTNGTYSEEEFNEYVHKKCQKWVTKHLNGEYKQRD